MPSISVKTLASLLRHCLVKTIRKKRALCEKVCNYKSAHALASMGACISNPMVMAPTALESMANKVYHNTASFVIQKIQSAWILTLQMRHRLVIIEKMYS